jgi:hypothetical protein
LLTAGELQLASNTNAGGNALSLAHCKFAGDNCANSRSYRRRICNAPGITVLCTSKNNYRSKKIKFYTADI